MNSNNVLVGAVVESTVIFFFNDTATTEIYTLSLHDALPIWLDARVFGGRFDAIYFDAGGGPHTGFLRRDADRARPRRRPLRARSVAAAFGRNHRGIFRPAVLDRKSTRLNSSHQIISYAVFCF